MQLSVSMVIYNTAQAVWQKAIVALYQAVQQLPAGDRITLYVVDNSPTTHYTKAIKAWLKHYPLNYQVIENPANKGYGYGNNLAINQAQSDYHVIMNPDIYLADDALQQAINFMQQHADVGLLAPMIHYPDGQWQCSFKQHPTLCDHVLRQFAPRFMQRWFHARMQRFEGKHLALDTIQWDIPSVMGSCMFFRTQLLQKLQGFDTRYFLYFEDDDISRRLSKLARLVYLPQVKVIHEHAHQTHHSWLHKYYFAHSLWRYFFRWGGLF